MDIFEKSFVLGVISDSGPLHEEVRDVCDMASFLSSSKYIPYEEVKKAVSSSFSITEKYENMVDLTKNIKCLIILPPRSAKYRKTYNDLMENGEVYFGKIDVIWIYKKRFPNLLKKKKKSTRYLIDFSKKYSRVRLMDSIHRIFEQRLLEKQWLEKRQSAGIILLFGILLIFSFLLFFTRGIKFFNILTLVISVVGLIVELSRSS